MCLLVGSISAAAHAADVQGQVVASLKERLLDRTLVTDASLVEDYGDRQFKVVSDRRVQFSGLRTTPEGFSIDMLLTIEARKLDKTGAVLETRPQLTVARRIELRPLEQAGRCVGTSRTIFSSQGDDIGLAESSEAFIEGDSTVLVQRDITPRVDPNDKAVIVGETKTVISTVNGATKLSVHYVESEWNPKTRGPEKKRFDVNLVYQESKSAASARPR